MLFSKVTAVVRVPSAATRRSCSVVAAFVRANASATIAAVIEPAPEPSTVSKRPLSALSAFRRIVASPATLNATEPDVAAVLLSNVTAVVNTPSADSARVVSSTRSAAIASSASVAREISSAKFEPAPEERLLIAV